MVLKAGTIRALLDYDPSTGIFRRLVATCGKVKVGDIAGSISTFGHRRIKVHGVAWLAHRLAWLHYYGRWPEKHIDHINGIPDDNRIENLREATRSDNLGNQKINKTNMSGYKGVSWKAANKKWVAQIRRNNRGIHIGLFNSPKEAHDAYVKAAKELYGEFARAK